MKWPWVSRKKLEAKELVLLAAQQDNREAVEYLTEERDRFRKHNETLKASIGTLRAQINAHKQDIAILKQAVEDQRKLNERLSGDLTAANKEHEQEIEELVKARGETAEQLKILREENDNLRKGVPSFKPRNVRWSGPTGVRAQAEAAAANQSSESQRIQKATEDQREEVISNGNET